MRSNKSELWNSILSKIWIWDEDKNIWITASYIPGTDNYVAEAESCKKQTELEWMLNRNIFTKIISKFHFQPEVDLLASYRPDPDSMHINAFSISL